MDVAPHVGRTRRKARHAKTLRLGGVTVVVAAVLTLAAGGIAWAGFEGQLANSTGTFSAGTMLLAGTTPGNVVCGSSSTATPITSNSASCPGDPLPAGALATTGAAAASTLADPGTSSPTAAAVSAPSCGVAQLLDAASSDPALAMGGVSYAQSGPLGADAIALDGSTGWFESTSSYSTPGAFTVLAWFKAGSGASGTIFSLSNSEFDSGATGSDLNLWIDPSGRLVWGVDTLDAQAVETPIEVTSTNPVTDGNWHLAAATYSGLSSTLYVDGASQGSAVAGSAIATESGWFPSIGWGAEGSTGWADPPGSAFFGGSLAMVSLSPAAVSAAQVAGLAAAATASNYESALSSDAQPTDNWEMADSGTEAYTGAVPVDGGGTTMPCQRVEVTVGELQGATTSCAVPAGAGACPALSPTTLLSSLTTAAPIDPPTTTAPVQLTIDVALTGVSPPGVSGLNLLPDLTVAAWRTGWSAALAYDSATAGM